MMDDAVDDFAAAFGGATEAHFSAKQSSSASADNTLVVCGRRVSPLWSNSIKVLVFVSVLYGGLAAIHVLRLIDGPSVVDAAARNGTDANSSIANATFAPRRSVADSSPIVHFLDENVRVVSIICLCATAPFYFLSMTYMFLAVFTDPGRLPRLDQIDQKEVDRLIERDKKQQQQQQQQHAAAGPPQQDASGGVYNEDASVFSDTSSTFHREPASPVATASGLAAGSSKDGKGDGARLSAALLEKSGNAYTATTTTSMRNRGGGEQKTKSSNDVSTSSATRQQHIIRCFEGTNVPLAARAPNGELVITGHLPPAHLPDAETMTVNGIGIATPFCSTCRIRRPVRSSHCVWCGRCVLGFDHECTIIGACVGHYNTRFFVGFVWSVGLLCWLCGFSATIVAVASASSDDGQSGDGNGNEYNTSRYFIAGVIYSVICYILALHLGLNLSGYYCFLACKGYTNREWVKRDFLYGNAWGRNPFAASSLCRQLSYLCCPLENTTDDPKTWAEGEAARKGGNVKRATSTSAAPAAESPGLKSMPAVSPGREIEQHGSHVESQHQQRRMSDRNALGGTSPTIVVDSERSPLAAAGALKVDYGSGIDHNTGDNSGNNESARRSLLGTTSAPPRADSDLDFLPPAQAQQSHENPLL